MRTGAAGMSKDPGIAAAMVTGRRWRWEIDDDDDRGRGRGFTPDAKKAATQHAVSSNVTV